MTRPVAAVENRAIVAMNAMVDEMDGIDKIKDTFKKVLDSGHRVYLYMVIKDKGHGTKTIRYAII